MPRASTHLVQLHVTTGALNLLLLDTELKLTRYYTFVDAQGVAVPELAQQQSGHVIPLADIPGSVRAALLLIDDWTTQLILEGLAPDGT